MDAKSDIDNVVIIGGLAIAAYIIYQLVNAGSAAVSAVGTATNAAGTSIGSSLFNFFNPNAAGSAVTYTASLPDGTIVGVNSNNVASDGTTTIGGQTYQMYVDPTITSGINKTLVPIP